MVDRPDAVLYTSGAQRSFTVEGLRHCEVDPSKLIERYGKAFGDDAISLGTRFKAMKEVRQAPRPYR